MQLRTIPHQLPVDDPAFCAFRVEVQEVFTAANASLPGGVPPYDMFVERLFKQTPTVSPQAVVDMLVKCTTPNDTDGPVHVDTHALLRMLEEAHNNPNGSALHAAVGCSGEGGELLDWVKKVAVYGKKWSDMSAEGQTTLMHLVEEMGDFRFYYQKLLNMLGMTDQDIQMINVVKLLARYNGGVYSDAAALARADKAPPLAESVARRYMGQQPR